MIELKNTKYTGGVSMLLGSAYQLSSLQIEKRLNDRPVVEYNHKLICHEGQVDILFWLSRSCLPAIWAGITNANSKRAYTRNK